MRITLKKKNISVGLLIIFIAIIILLYIFTNTHQSNDFKVGYIEFVTDLPLFVAIENGYFEDQGINVKAVKCGDSNEALNLLLSNHIDAVAHLAFSVFWTAEEKFTGRFKLFLPCYETGDSTVSYLLVRKNSHITQLSQLKSKKIGTITGITQLTYLKLVLENLGLDPDKDVKIVQIAPNLQVQALQAGQFDVLFTVDPYGNIALKNNIASLLQANPRSKNIIDPFWAAAAAISSETLNNPELSGKIYLAMAKAVDYIRMNEKNAKEILTRYTPLDTAIANNVGLYKYSKIEEFKDYVSVQELADKMLKYGALTKKINTQSIFLTKSEIEEN